MSEVKQGPTLAEAEAILGNDVEDISDVTLKKALIRLLIDYTDPANPKLKTSTAIGEVTVENMTVDLDADEDSVTAVKGVATQLSPALASDPNATATAPVDLSSITGTITSISLANTTDYTVWFSLDGGTSWTTMVKQGKDGGGDVTAIDRVELDTFGLSDGDLALKSQTGNEGNTLELIVHSTATV